MSEVTRAALNSLRQEIVAMKELLTERREGDLKALELQAAEYERRLESLNHEAARIQNVLDESVPREVFDNYKTTEQAAKELARKEMQLWKDEVNSSMTMQEARAKGSAKLWALASGIVATLINVAVSWFTKG